MGHAQWLTARSIVIGDGSPPRHDAAVLIESDRIVDIRPAAEAPRDAVDFGDATIAPGFVDAHVHLLFDYQVDHQRTRRAVVESSRDRLLARALYNGADCLRAGVTTIRDLGDRDGIVESARDLIREGLVPGPRIYAAGTPVTITAGHLGWLGGRADSPQEIVALTRSLVARGVDVIKVVASGGNMTAESNKHLPQFTVDELRLVVAEAHRGGLPVASHAHNSEAVRRSIAAGIDTIEHCGWFDAEGRLDLTEGDIESMRSSGAIASVTLAGIARQLLPDPEPTDDGAVEVARQMSRSGGDLLADYEWARRLMAAGVEVLISSDAGVRFTPFRGFLESVRAGVVAFDVDASTAISLATLVPARALRADADLGSIEPGKLADLVVLDAVITEGSRDLGSVRSVYKDGRVVVADGRMTW